LPAIDFGACYDIKWTEGDAAISAVHELGDLQGIDMLGELDMGSKTIWIAIQAKDHEQAIPIGELKKFVDSFKKLESNKTAINSDDRVIAVLSLAKPKSFSYPLYENMMKSGALTVVESISDVGEKTANSIIFMLDKMM
jgi:hypothetical protein